MNNIVSVCYKAVSSDICQLLVPGCCGKQPTGSVFHMEWLCSLQEAYFRYMAENPTAGLTQEEEDENIDYDSDGNPIASIAKKIILPLPPIDHTEVQFIIVIEHRQF